MALSAMMRQYLNIKEKHKDAILFFRLGDFYEMFFDDAKLVSRELELTLTGKDCGLEERAPMCGIPYHSYEGYVAKLIEKGYKVAICEQLTDPALSKGLVERDIIRIITPGTVIDQSMLKDKDPNFILSAYVASNKAGLAFCDISTGEFFVYQINDAENRIYDELSRIMPREIISCQTDGIEEFCPRMNASFTLRDEASFELNAAKKALNAQFPNQAEDISLLDRLAVRAAGGLLSYLISTQMIALSHITEMSLYEKTRYMTVDHTASMNLELTRTLRDGARKGSLLGVIDKTVTAMGGRLIKEWVAQPLIGKEAIESRLDAVEYFVKNPIILEEIRDAFSDVYDVERLLSKIAYGTVNPHDCLSLMHSLKAIPSIKRLLSDTDNLLSECESMLDPMEELCSLLESAISEDSPLLIKEGGIFKNGFNEQLDRYREASKSGKTWLAQLEQKEREETGIKSLKVGYNHLFGYYIEVTRSFYDLVPIRYTRKQTLANAERFITEELKQLEDTILGAEENAVKLEYELFMRMRDELKDNLAQLKKIAYALKTIDALESLAKAARERNYVRPKLNTEGRYDIEAGRHPVVECALGTDEFVPNDTHLDSDSRVMIITGPNMAGKSTYMRQVALIVLMAHLGSFVPADSADISVTDRIFTRIGANDDLYGGMSTFMVEMSEMATILKHATEHSLVILDEVGRGTSTFDGMSIAWAAVEYLAGEKCRARTLFATHYHELSVLEGQLPGVVNYRVTATERGEDVIFLRKVVPGGEDKSYGISVAKLAGLPKGVLSRARQIMARLEVDDIQKGSIGQTILDKKKNSGDMQLTLDNIGPMSLIEEIRAIDVMAMSPIDALNTLFTLCEKARRI